MVRFVGLDVHKRVVAVCILDAEGRVILRATTHATREELTHLATKILQPQDRVALEATTNTWAVVRILKPHVAEVAVSNPLKTKLIAEARVKTDKVDAETLAQLLRTDFLPRVWEPDEKTQELRRLTGRRSALVGQRTAVKNRLHSVLAQRLIEPPDGGGLFRARSIEWLKTLELDADGRLFIDSDLRLLEDIGREIAALDAVLVARGYENPQVKLLMTMPGVSVTVAEAVLAALGDIKRFKDGDRAASYLGLVPSTKQSAAHCYHGPITKAGNGHARWMLVQAAQHLKSHPGPLGVFFRRIAGKKNHNVAVVASARKLVVIAWHMLTKNEPYRYAQPKVTEEKLRRLRVAATGLRRKTGPKPGTPNAPKLGPGVMSRTVKPLAQVYAEEGLPDLRPAPAGEDRAIRGAAVSSFVQSLTRPQILRKRDKKEEA